MNQLPDRTAIETPRRKQTPRVPANFLYTRLVPLAIGMMVVVLIAIIVMVVVALITSAVTY